MFFTQGPTATTTCSQSIEPLSVSTLVIALLLLPFLNPVTLTPVTIFVPLDSAFLAIALIESLLKA